MLITFVVPANARIVRPVVPSPVNTNPGKTRLKPDFDGIATIIWSSGFEVPPYSIVKLTVDALVLFA